MALAEIYRSEQLHDCEQRAFLLYAVGIHSEIVRYEGGFILAVAEESHRAALEELARHDAEARAAPPAPAAVSLHRHAWIGSVLYALVMMFVAWCAGEGLGGRDWYAVGSLNASVWTSGEWSRVATALTLHGDVAHLIANLVFGVWFGYFAGQLLGAGVAWLTIFIGAALGNLLDTALMPPGVSSIGASTAVFAALGLVAAQSWRRRSGMPMRWAYRYAPLVAGVALLAFTGAGGENTDVVAHIAGFLCGAMLGLLHSWRPLAALESRRVQLAAGATTLAVLSAAWIAALS